MFKKLFQKLLTLLGVNDNLVCYIYGNEALPQPLSTQEEIDLLQKFHQGDQDAKSLLVEHNLRLVVYLAKKFENTKVDMEDLVSVGTIGLIKAINSFKTDKQIKLATYASRCIENEILMYLRKMARRKNEVSLDEPLNVDQEGNELLLGDVLGSDAEYVYDTVEEKVERQLLHQGLQQLSERERAIVSMRFGIDCQEKTQKEVADLLGISQSYISRLEKKIVSRLKKEIAKFI
ncbi:MAG: RNA polymerase sporulation sigma factor SigE [Clostridia bacterium]|nr:RNA polymerase sporulation sigma factor SigE [Clostridia bacterium]